MNTLSKNFESGVFTKNRFGLLILLIIIQLLIIYAFIQGDLIIVLGVILGLAFFLFSIFSVERSFYLMALYYLILPDQFFEYSFPLWKITFAYYYGIPIFLWLLGNWLIYLIHNQIPYQSHYDETYSIRRITFQPMDKLLLIFIGTFTISGILGLLRGFNRNYWAYDYFGLFLYSGFFIYLYSPLSKKHKRLFDFAVFCSIIVSFQYIQSLIYFGGTILLKRITSTHIHIAQLTLPYLGAIILYHSSKLRRMLSLIIFPVILVGVIISQQRALWASIFITLVILLFIFVYDKRQILFKNVTKIIYGIIGFIIFFGGLYIFLQILTRGKLLPTIVARILFFISPSLAKYDISAMTRIGEIKDALSTLGNDFLLGKGLGYYEISRWRANVQLTLDNSFAYLYWKTGIVGLFTFIMVIFYFLYRCISVLRKKLMTDEKIFVLTVFLNMLGMVIVAFTNSVLVHNPIIIIWAATFAVVESIARKYEEKIPTNTANASK
jgi:hypothetical protein